MKAILKFLLAGLPLAILGACSSDEPDGGGQKPQTADKTEIRYLKVNLVNNGGESARANVGDTPGSDYASGTEPENKIRTVDFYFYDQDKKYHSHVPLSITAPTDPSTDGITDPSVSGFYQANVPVSLVQGATMPKYVICIINAVQPQYYENRPMAEAQKQILTSLYSSEGKDAEGTYFGMSNSVYYGLDVVTGESNQLIMATPFDSNKLYTETQLDKMTAEELKEATIDIYVERYAVKVQFGLQADAVKDFTSGNGITLTFEPKGWGLSAYEKSFYFLKSYRSVDNDATTFSSFETMNGLLFSGWNNEAHHRSFWARTPAYYQDEYPIVSDDITDVDGWDTNPDNYKYAVYYMSYNECNAPIGTNGSFGHLYTMESTMKVTRLTGATMPDQYTPIISIPSVVLVGQYKHNGEAKTFYSYQKDNNGKEMLYADNAGDLGDVITIKERLLSTQSVILLKEESGRYRPVRPVDLESKVPMPFVVEHPEVGVRKGNSNDANSEIKVGGDIVTLQINGTNTGFWFFDPDKKEYVELSTDASVMKANRLLYQNLGGAHAYINGMAFFSAPIQHWGWYRNDNENRIKDGEEVSFVEWDWTKMKTGDFGLVRNHIYTMEIGSISGLGNGVLDPTYPLLPPSEAVSYAVAFRVNILKWATLPKQTWNW